jgi:hypothetical protein
MESWKIINAIRNKSTEASIEIIHAIIASYGRDDEEGVAKRLCISLSHNTSFIDKTIYWADADRLGIKPNELSKLVNTTPSWDAVNRAFVNMGFEHFNIKLDV